MQWPPLAQPYDDALRQAVQFVLDRYDDVIGIIAAGTIITGTHGPSSDLDIYVLKREPRRQRIQRFFNGVPAEIFCNPPQAVRGYFESESRAARPCTAHMFSTGFVVLDADPVVEALRAEARQIVADGPTVSADKLRFKRYAIGTLFEDALDVAAVDPDTATMIMAQAVRAMLQYAFLREGRWLPRDKDLLTAVTNLNPALAQWGRGFFAAVTWDDRLVLAEKIAAATSEVRGFFEWESALEEI